MQDKEEERSLVNVENKLTKDGFTADFNVVDGRLHTIGDDANTTTYGPEDVTIVDFYRFEGESDPDDMSILYAIEASDGVKGTISTAYGVYADTETDEFLKKVEDLGKNLVKGHK
ncbi:MULTISPECIES: hypothetical protein [Hymenobacter]|uniref:Phosphoribosylpyrophosphate synthetase n=1 Tax=Hymenobacter jejuensis TaxID=2502781 RepID=A0A5B7ZY65_9BACT|nr:MULTISPECIES: hypothetical protein [Hymenobacter]MBC6991815.1 hypothetical protein [Hymenobacter sp. BT491]QDA60134.1 hypothetical protein FHG12_08435 [Hymenobacter jejuensis]